MLGSNGLILPPELLTAVFRLATSTPATPKLFETDYHAFHDPPGEEERYYLRKADETASALVLVCKEWRQLALEYFYESIRLNHGMNSLLQSLHSSTQDGQKYAYGRWVRRLELSVVEQDPSKPVTPLDILHLCPNVEVLVKYDDDLLPHSLEGADLTRIKRLDWWYARYRDGIHQFDTENDDGSRGLNFLHQVLSQAPNLKYLSLGNRYMKQHIHQPVRLTLSSLTTLRLESIPIDLGRELLCWSLPNLRNLIADSMIMDLSFQLLLKNPSIRVIEFLDDTFLLEEDIFTTTLIAARDVLQELSYYIQFTHPPSPTVFFPMLNCIRLHSKKNVVTRYSTWPPILDDTIRIETGKHFAVFKRSSFPSLNRIVLHGNWDGVMSDPHFQFILEALDQENICLELEDC